MVYYSALHHNSSADSQMLSFQTSLLFALILLWQTCVLELVLCRYMCRLAPVELFRGQLARHCGMVHICQLLSLPGTLLTGLMLVLYCNVSAFCLCLIKSADAMPLLCYHSGTPYTALQAVRCYHCTAFG